MARLRIPGMLLALASAMIAARPARAQTPPNIVFVVADDLGYGDIGCFGQDKIRTPNLDRLAAEGMRLTRHYAGNAVCAPSRCVLMTGRHPGHAPIRNNREAQPEGQFPLPAGTETLARRLKDRGYATGAFGKWGLGGPGSSGEPMRQGIDRFFGYNCQRIAHNYYPTLLWDDDRRHPLDNPPFSAHDRLKPGEDPAKPEAYARFSGRQYAPDLIAEQAVRFVEANKDRPFFLFLPTTVPHLALQVPDDSLREYADQRWDEAPYLGDRNYLPHPTPRAAYAAMITRMDREIGRIMGRVRDLGLDDRTICVFTSDNGPLYDRLGGTDADFFRSAGGLKGRKGSLDEGGVRVPCIVRWTGKIAAGTTSDRVTGFEDWTPTLIELAGGSGSIPGLDGISFAPTLMGQKQSPRPFLYREFPAYGGQQAVWAGKYKAIRRNLAPTPAARKRGDAPPPSAELYDLEADPAEAKDLAADLPETLAELLRIGRREHTPNPDFPFPRLDAESNP
ncbi:arylsulfatase [Tundrisphaera sp. TA3]|uniref:arylsulfatase n=1 Tax=Tundrisphaera sp. TA3 TaxID=3435775 RepID=UPI003EBD7A52